MTNFETKYEIYNWILQELYKNNEPDSIVAARADVSSSTIRNWRMGLVLTPRIDTLTKVAESLGARITIRLVKGTGRIRLI